MKSKAQVSGWSSACLWRPEDNFIVNPGLPPSWRQGLLVFVTVHTTLANLQAFRGFPASTSHSAEGKLGLQLYTLQTHAQLYWVWGLELKSSHFCCKCLTQAAISPTLGCCFLTLDTHHSLLGSFSNLQGPGLAKPHKVTTDKGGTYRVKAARVDPGCALLSISVAGAGRTRFRLHRGAESADGQHTSAPKTKLNREWVGQLWEQLRSRHPFGWMGRNSWQLGQPISHEDTLLASRVNNYAKPLASVNTESQ